MVVKELSKEEYKGYRLDFTYESSFFYDIKSNLSNNHMVFRLELMPFSTPFVKYFEDHLFEPYYEDPKAWGIFDEDILCGVIEINHEHWNKRIRITQLLILEEYRKQGIGHRLMSIVKDYFDQSDYRAICLETQSSNYPAIQFYLKEGFSLIGFDTICYTNFDIDNHEVRLEFGLLKKEVH